MKMDTATMKFNISSSPHVRCKETTASIMYNVVLSLMPATVVGVIHFWRYGGTALGVNTLLIVLTSVVTAVLSEYIFDKLTHRPNTVRDGSAIVTGLLLALSLPPTVPLYIPILGSLFAIIFVKCLFGGLGQNFMNPALAGRAFVSASFTSVVANFTIDGVSSATPLELIRNGESVDALRIFLGQENGVIGLSVVALLVGAAYLFYKRIITWEIPVSFIGGFVILVGLFGDKGFEPVNMIAQVCGGGVIMGAFFMATDMVTCPISKLGHSIYGVLLGVLAGVFRVFGSAADSVSYAIIIGNLFAPLIDQYVVPKPYCYRATEKRNVRIPKEAIILCVITLVAGLALSGVNAATKERIAQNEREAEARAYRAVCPAAVEFAEDSALAQTVAQEGDQYGAGQFGQITINSVKIAQDQAGEKIGYVVSVTNGNAYDGTLTMIVGFDMEGAITGVAFTELHETAGMGMRADEPAFKEQFVGAKVDSFLLNKDGGSTADNEIDCISGATRTSSAVVNAVNAALHFIQNHGE